MSYDEYWYGDCYKAKYYRESYEIQIKHKDEEFWTQGMYIYDALCRVSPILHAFSKSGTKPLPYPTKPYTYSIVTPPANLKPRQEIFSPPAPAAQDSYRVLFRPQTEKSCLTVQKFSSPSFPIKKGLRLRTVPLTRPLKASYDISENPPPVSQGFP